MFNIGGGEFLVIAVIALIVLGPQRLPEAARTIGKVMGDLRRLSSGFQSELKSALDDSGPSRPTAPARDPLKTAGDAPATGGSLAAAVGSVSEQGAPAASNGTGARRTTPLKAAPAAKAPAKRAAPKTAAGSRKAPAKKSAASANAAAKRPATKASGTQKAVPNGGRPRTKGS